ncbi:unnamed protein product [Amoebophrya sp. A25]|nr:unnamed protein product [Amoebophrya sp. A25]|eukprot:GSA25T00024087001.1
MASVPSLTSVDLFEPLSGYIVLGTQPEEADPGLLTQRIKAPSITGKRATCTTPSAENRDVLLKRIPMTYTPKDCAHHCDAAGSRCTHWSLSLGPVWNTRQAPGVYDARHRALAFTPKAGAPGHCFLCGVEDEGMKDFHSAIGHDRAGSARSGGGQNKAQVNTREQKKFLFDKYSMLRDAPGMYSYVGVKRQMTAPPPRIKEAYRGENGALYSRNWSYLPPSWLKFL